MGFSGDESRVFVVLLNWNGYSDTQRCISSLMQSRYAVNVIVVDNDSLERDIESVPVDYPGVRLIQSQDNGGFSKGNNQGIRAALEAGADYIFILNNDTVVESDAIGKLAHFMDGHDDVVAASPLILYGDDRDLIWYGGGDFIWAKGGARSSRFNMALTEVGFSEPERVGFISGCAMFVRASAIRQVQGFDEAFFMYVEDVDLSLQLSALGKMYLEPAAKIYHYAHSTARKGASKAFRNPASADNPNLIFYLRHVLSGYFYLVAKHEPGIVARSRFYLYFYLKWLKHALLYLLRGRLDAFLLVLRILLVRKSNESSTGA